MTSCFSCFTVKFLEDFCLMTVARERSRLAPLKAMPRGRPTPLANAAIEVPPVITADVITLVSTMPVIALNRFIFFATRSGTSISSRKNASISANFLSDMFIWINFAHFFIVVYTHSLIVEDKMSLRQLRCCFHQLF